MALFDLTSGNWRGTAVVLSDDRMDGGHVRLFQHSSQAASVTYGFAVRTFTIALIDLTEFIHRATMTRSLAWST
jgi:hypothetical protein